MGVVIEEKMAMLAAIVACNLWACPSGVPDHMLIIMYDSAPFALDSQGIQDGNKNQIVLMLASSWSALYFKRKTSPLISPNGGNAVLTSWSLINAFRPKMLTFM